MTTTTTDNIQIGDSTTGTPTNTTWTCSYTRPKAEQGWECPRCGQINAPWTLHCNCSRNNQIIACNDCIYKIGWWEDYVTTHGEADDVTKNPNIYTTMKKSKRNKTNE